jgi:mannan endo-1,4-beta-mannosidase
MIMSSFRSLKPKPSARQLWRTLAAWSSRRRGRGLSAGSLEEAPSDTVARVGSPSLALKRSTRLVPAMVVLALLGSSAYGQGEMNDFITRSGSRLMDGTREFRFISFNIPNLHLIEDNLAFDANSSWRLPDEFEISDALETVRQEGGLVARTYVISVRGVNDNPSVPRHVLAPGQFEETAFRALDKVLAVANQKGIRLIIPFVDQWRWWGGIAEYAAFRGKRPDAFWTDPQLIADFKQTINYIINRRNTITGILYKNDKAILAWETGNELGCPYSWTSQIAAYIKSLDRNHLVIDGYHAGQHGLRTQVFDDPNVDVITTHHYPGQSLSLLDSVEQARRLIGARKAYFVGEFGFIPTDLVRQLLDKVIADGLSGALVWSLRFHDRDGGFYWHAEGASSEAYKAYHWPGFTSGESYDERALLALLHAKAYEIRGQALPAMTRPDPPVLLPIENAGLISWRGSTGAAQYDVERAGSPSGPWVMVGADIDDSSVQYTPLFSDNYAEVGEQYYYRVRAKNEAGASEPSNVVGPVQVDSLIEVDEMHDTSHLFSRGGSLSIDSRKPRSAREVVHRLKGTKGSWLVYRTLNPLRSARLQVLFESAIEDFDFLESVDGISYSPVRAVRRNHFEDSDDYQYWKPVTYQINGFGSGARFLKVVFKNDAQISRVELEHRK